MNQTMVTTNLRVPAEDWYEFKNFASELNVSTNGLVNKLIQKVNAQSSFVSDLLKPKTRRDPIWDWPNLAKKIKDKPMGLSAEDEEIYAI